MMTRRARTLRSRSGRRENRHDQLSGPCRPRDCRMTPQLRRAVRWPRRSGPRSRAPTTTSSTSMTRPGRCLPRWCGTTSAPAAYVSCAATTPRTRALLRDVGGTIWCPVLIGLYGAAAATRSACCVRPPTPFCQKTEHG
jgi:hypothetical protein